MRPRIGLSVMPLETRHEAIIGLAAEGDRLGYDGFFLPETWAYDITVLLAEAAARTRRITLGTGIVGIWSRSAATMAMAAATRNAASASNGSARVRRGVATRIAFQRFIPRCRRWWPPTPGRVTGRRGSSPST